MSSTASATLSTWFKIKGVNYSISSACATSNHCIGNAYEIIQLGKQDIMFAGGCEELDWTLSVLFDGMGAMSSHFNDRPAVASRAYDKDRDGFVIAGGAGVLVLEELEHAKARGARIYGEIVGYGATSDGDDMVAPSGEGAARCMRMALRPGRRARSTTSTRTRPRRRSAIWTRSRRSARCSAGDDCPPISATKSLTGHSLGATGVQEAIYCLLMMNNGFIAGIGPYRRTRSGNSPTCRSCASGWTTSNSIPCCRIPSASAAPTRRWCSHVTRAEKNKGNGAGDNAMTAGLMSGKRGLVMGVANDHSIAWGIARQLAEAGAELAFTYQPPSMDKRVRPLAESVGSDFVIPCDVGLDSDADDPASIDSMFAAIARRWGSLDFVVHAIAFSDKAELKGRYADTTRANFQRTMVISCFSFTEVARRAAAMMPNGGAMLTLTYGGSTRVMPNYNVMGVAKAALEASVRYLAVDFGDRGIRVNAISAGPVRTLAGSGISDARIMFNYQKENSPLRRTVGLDEIGNTGRLPPVRPLLGGHRRDPFRRFRLQHRLDAAASAD